MDEISTSDDCLKNIVKAALLSGSYGSPSERVLDFIRNFAIVDRV